MCAGVTTFNALRNSPARAGDRVAILGIGGLGHLGVQYAAKMGFETIAIARGRDKETFARSLGAHHYIDSQTADVSAELQRLGGVTVALSTVTAATAMLPVLQGLAIDGELLVVGASAEALPINTAAMIGGRHAIKAWPSETRVDSEATLAFSALAGVRASIETMPLERAQEAFDRMMARQGTLPHGLDHLITPHQHQSLSPRPSDTRSGARSTSFAPSAAPASLEVRAKPSNQHQANTSPRILLRSQIFLRRVSAPPFH